MLTFKQLITSNYNDEKFKKIFNRYRILLKVPSKTFNGFVDCQKTTFTY